MQFDQDKSQYGGDAQIQELLEDLALGDEVTRQEGAKRDSTVFMIDCSPSIFKVIEGEQKSEFDKIIESYANFMMSKIIANTNDRVGLILFNINAKNNTLNFEHIYTVHELELPSAKSIKSARTIQADLIDKYELVSQAVPIHHLLWLYGQQIKQLENAKYHLRLFLFTPDDCPHPEGDQRREQAINHARQLASKNVHIELFPIRSQKSSTFNIKKFYQQILTLDPQEINEAVIDSSSKILDLQSRLRQKQFKKRTLNRLTMKIGKQSDIGIKIFSLYNKAKKPLGKKVEAATNKPLQRVVKKINTLGQTLFDEQIGTYYPLGGEKIKISKNQMNKIKQIQPPGLTLIGFKPRNLIKPYHNIRTSYFIYPDEEHVSGSSQFFDALIDQLLQSNMVAIVKIMPRANQELRFAALFPQAEQYDSQDHYQTPPGFNMVILPYADDIVNFTGNKTATKPQTVSSALIQVTKLLINNLTVHNFDFRDFQNPSLQKFYGHLQAHALNQQDVQEREDLLMPDYKGFSKFSDIIDLVKQTAKDDVKLKKQQQGVYNCDQSEDSNNQHVPKNKKQPKIKKQKGKETDKEVKRQEAQKKSKIKTDKLVKKQKQTNGDESIMQEVEAAIFQGETNKLKVATLRQYLKQKQLDDKGKKQQLIDRIMVYISHLNEI